MSDELMYLKGVQGCDLPFRRGNGLDLDHKHNRPYLLPLFNLPILLLSILEQQHQSSCDVNHSAALLFKRTAQYAHHLSQYQQTIAMPPSSKQWETALMPSLAGKIVVVTGANAGLGFATTLPLVRKGAHVVLACRDATRGEEAAQRIRDLLQQERDEALAEAVSKEDEGVAEYMNLDVGSLTNVRAFAEAFTARFECLDLLVLNAGVKAIKYAVTVDGFESQFGVNHLGHFALTALLLESLKKSRNARVVTVSSISHHGCALDFDNLSASPDKYAAMDAYRSSKLCNMLFAYELHRRLQLAGIENVASVPCHPGVTESNLLPNLLENYDWAIIRGFIRFIHSLPWAQTNAMGALCILCAGTDPQVVPGEYIGPHGFWEFYGYPRTVGSSKQSLSEEDAAKLWAESEKLTGVQFNVAK